MSDTPRTDELCLAFGSRLLTEEQKREALVEHARQLERELAAAQAQIVALETKRKEDVRKCERIVETIAISRHGYDKYCDSAQIRAAFPEDFQDER